MIFLKVKQMFGVATTGVSLYVSRMDEVSQWLKVISLVVGIIVGVLTALSLSLTIYWKVKHNKKAVRKI